MPRKRLPIADHIEYISILDHQGKVDPDLEPEISDDLLLRLYRVMILSRRFDEKMLDLQRQGRVGTFPPITGQEAAQLGAVVHLGARDWLVPSFRETVAELWRGRSLVQVLLYYNGYNEGLHIPATLNNLPTAIPVGSQVLHAVGLGWAAHYKQTNEIVMSFFGDGATSEGDFHEGLNFAAVFQTPTIFICQNNQWAISIPLSKQTRSPTIAQKAIAYGMPGVQVDGNDLLAVYVAVRDAVERARKGNGPTLIECVTYRLMMHTTADDPSKYRSEGEVSEWQSKDPLPRFTTYLLDKGVLSEQLVQDIANDTQAEIQAAVELSEQQMQQIGDPLDMFEHLYAELPPYTVRQKQELAQQLSSADKEQSGD